MLEATATPTPEPAEAGPSPAARDPWTAPALEFASFRQQETIQILLNLGVMAALMLLHAVFRPLVSSLTAAASVAFTLRFAMQIGEAFYLNGPGVHLGPRATWWYARLSIVANVAFTAIVARLSSGQEAHYTVLMVIPVIAAAVRLGIPGLAAVVASVVTVNVALVWTPSSGASQRQILMELFEATTVSLIFLVVAAVTRIVVEQLRTREVELRRSLAALAATRDRLVREEKLAAVGRLASAIAHEVRNPVSMIASAVATARRPDTAEVLRDEVFGILSKESQRLQRLTEDFLSYARQRPPQLRESSLSEALGLTAGLVRGRAEELGVSLDARCDDAAPVMLDPFQIQQALLNLAVNGLEATPRGGALRLAAHATPGGAVFEVENSGPAIAPDVAARLGEPFFTTKATGTGLGLAIARTIAVAHGGELALATNEPGRVRFELRLGTAGRAAA